METGKAERSRLYYRVQPKGLGILHQSEASNGEKSEGLHVFDLPELIFHTDGPLYYYGDEILEIQSTVDPWDTQDFEGVVIDPRKSKVIRRFSIPEFVTTFKHIDPDGAEEALRQSAHGPHTHTGGCHGKGPSSQN